LVVFHCRPELLTTSLGLDPGAIPAPLDAMCHSDRPASSVRVGLGPEVHRNVQQIINARYTVPSALRAAFLESAAVAVLCELMTELANKGRLSGSTSRLSPRDLQCIYEARDLLAQHFASPPRIPRLARLVGVNQTKLKAGFRQALGMTIYEYVLRLRMERASELLLSGDHGIAEIAHMVGYQYPANFTFAFKRQFGELPRARRPR
jgi:AraC family transcriptional activator of pyochelin receptor